MTPGPAWFTRPLYPGDQGEDVRTVQLLLRCEPTGVFDHATATRVRGYRMLAHHPPGSSVDERVATSLGELR